PARHMLQPFRVFEVPIYSLGKPLFESYGGFPPEFLIYLRCINRIAAVVAWPILYIGDQLLAGTGRIAELFIHQPAKQFYQVNIFPFVKTTNIIGLTTPPFVKYQVDR